MDAEELSFETYVCELIAADCMARIDRLIGERVGDDDDARARSAILTQFAAVTRTDYVTAWRRAGSRNSGPLWRAAGWQMSALESDAIFRDAMKNDTITEGKDRTGHRFGLTVLLEACERDWRRADKEMQSAAEVRRVAA